VETKEDENQVRGNSTCAWRGDERGIENRIKGNLTHAMKKLMEEESLRVVRKEKTNKKKAQRGDKQHNHMNLTHTWKGVKRGRGVRGFWVDVAWENNS